MREGNWGRMYGEGGPSFLLRRGRCTGAASGCFAALGTALLGGHQGPSGGPNAVNHLPGSAQAQLNFPQQTRLPIWLAGALITPSL